MSDYADRLEKVYSGVVYDALVRMGHGECVLPSEIRPLDINSKIAGRIFTVRGKRVTDLSEDDTLLAWVKFLSRAPAGHVVICQPNDNTISHMGELSSETLKYKGVRGYIVDGGCRDSAFIEKIGFPVFCKYYTSKDIVKRWVPDAYEEPITIGNVTIHNGDYVMADRDSAVVIPQSLVEEVVTTAETMVNTENKVRTAILQGGDPVDAYLRYRKF